jgi:type IV secretion system protein VirD4
VLAALLHAAALGGYSMREVLVWVSDPDGATGEVQRLLRRSSEPNYEADALQFLTTNDRTRSSITATVMPALSWMTDPTAEQSAQGGSFDVEGLLAERGTVYMLGAEDAQTAPLVTALTGHIAREARRIAGLQESGRLDPPLTLVLDEAAIICPVPLDKWTADMGGRNITIHIAAQSRAQLRQRYGEDGAAAIMNNASTMLVFGGTKDDKDLQAYATLTGERDEEVATYDGHGRVTSTTVRRVPVLSGAQIAQLPATRVVVYRPDMPVAVGKAPMAWNRRDVRLDNLHDRSERAADTWRQIRAWASPRLAAVVEWTVARLARTAERARQLRAERALRRMRPPLDPARIEELEREPATAQVIALPTQRKGEDDS